MKIAIVTGASSGIGQVFAVQLAQQLNDIDEMWLIARRQDRLEQLAQTLPVATRILCYDLTDRSAIEQYKSLLEELQPQVHMLVNASGFGRFCLTQEAPLDVTLNMIDLNVKALVSLCHLTLPYMRRGDTIINMGSISSFQPVPYVNVYAATKSFVLSFSRALGAELKPRGIHVLAVCPMWVQTEFFDHAVVDETAVVYYNKMWQPEQVVTQALKDLKKGRDVSVLGAYPKLQVLLTKLIPHKLVMRVWLKQQKHI